MVEEEGNWVVLLHYHHQGRLSTAGYARPVCWAARGCKNNCGPHQRRMPGSEPEHKPPGSDEWSTAPAGT